MANRPRRPKTGGRPETIIDGDAERIEGAGASGETATTLGETPPAGGSEPEFAPEQAKEPLRLEPEAPVVTGGEALTTDVAGEPGDALDRPVDAAEEARVHDAVTGPAPETVETVDPVEERPLPGGEAASLSNETTSEAPSQEFAREEGFAAAGATGAAPPRDFGEFEDDEHTPADAARSPGTVSDTSPYHAGHAAEPKGAGFGGLLGVGALGAAIALLLGGTALYGGLLPPPPSRTEQVNPQQFAQAGEVQQLNGDVQSLREAVEQVRSAQAAGGAGSGTVATADFTQLADRVAAAERAIQSGGSSTGDAAAAAAGASDAANTARETAASAETTANAAREAATAAQAAADEARGGVSAAQQAAQNAQTAANETRGAIDGFETRLAAIETANRQAAVALSAAGLKAAIDRGTPFMSELESFARASNGTDAVAPLRDFAASGVPTASTLAARWQGAEAAILDAVRPATSTEDVGTQVLSGLRSLVTVRPQGASVAPDAPGPQAAVARMDAAVEAGDYGAWLREWDGLPEAAKTASAEFAAQVRARVEADRVIQDTINGAVGASASQG
ncbi:hypothetical protein [Aureimonas sp. ME7]|uniref:COG4223 family protein n=1 Tax=Aureimonas sp. ME7 TaxID=2744252 RepID=UPI0015F4BC9A|nr:hypothetical protein [Aureimonas sp. ME7]